jgi:ASC-1-like (ASCH) protein
MTLWYAPRETMCANLDDEIVLERFTKKFENIKVPELNSFEKILIGKIIKEYPVLNEDYAIRYNIYLAEKEGKYSIVLRWINILPDVDCEPEIYRFDMENVEKLRDIFDDALKTTVAKPLKKRIE